MDLEAIQNAKNIFAKSQDPKIDPCINPGCKYTGCTCKLSNFTIFMRNKNIEKKFIRFLFCCKLYQ